MKKDTKFLIGTFAAIVIFVVGIAVWASIPTPGNVAGAQTGGDRFVPSVEATGITADTVSINIGKAPYGGGLVNRSYKIKNESGKDLKLRKIVTSCMCTKARVKFGDKFTKFYAMEMNGDKNPLITYDFKSGSEAELEFNFDPAAHGPAGIGPIDRVITLYFDNGYKEFKFNGEVVKS